MRRRHQSESTKFVDVPSFVSIFSGNPAEPFYFVKVTEKRIAIKEMKE